MENSTTGNPLSQGLNQGKGIIGVESETKIRKKEKMTKMSLQQEKKIN